MMNRKIGSSSLLVAAVLFIGLAAQPATARESHEHHRYYRSVPRYYGYHGCYPRYYAPPRHYYYYQPPGYYSYRWTPYYGPGYGYYGNYGYEPPRYYGYHNGRFGIWFDWH